MFFTGTGISFAASLNAFSFQPSGFLSFPDLTSLLQLGPLHSKVTNVLSPNKVFSYTVGYVTVGSFKDTCKQDIKVIKGHA